MRDQYVGRVFKGKDGFYWNIRARNGRNVCCSGEDFTRKRDARRALKNFCTTFGVTITPRD